MLVIEKKNIHYLTPIKKSHIFSIFIHSIAIVLILFISNNQQERPLMQSIKGRRLIVYACVICWTTKNNQGQSPLSL